MKIGKKEEKAARKRAEYFYKKYGFSEDNIPTPKKLEEALWHAAAEMRPRSWYNLKRYVMFDQYEKGFKKAVERLQKLSNPMTDRKVPLMLKPSQGPVKAKRKRMKNVPDDMHAKLLRAALDKDDKPLAGSLYIARLIGCRPSEIPLLRVLDDGTVYVTHVKGSEAGDRGIDHIVKVSSEHLLQLRKAIEAVSKEKVSKTPFEKKMDNRLRELVKKIYPRRKTRPCLYSYRHQLGSSLKEAVSKGQITRSEAAYIMGHQSTDSLDEYGDRRLGGGLNVRAAVDSEKISELVRENHSEPPRNDGPVAASSYGEEFTI